MSRVFNFSSGPGAVPEECLRQARDEMLEWNGRGYSVIECSHRAPEYVALQQQAIDGLRELLAVPRDYRILLLQGGAHLQFAMVPLNLLGAKFHADYIDSGYWSKKAIEEAERFCNVRIAGSSSADGNTYAPSQDELELDASAAYVHYCSNETIHGVEFPYVPDAGSVPLVADMSSHFLSRPIEVSRFGLIYAGAQKNFGPAGLCAVIVRDDLIGRCAARWPTMLDYKTHADTNSGYNTPPTFSVYFAGLVLAWLRRQGGLAEIERRSVEKAALLYDAIDGAGGFYSNRVRRGDRSRMNVPFTIADETLTEDFLAQAESHGLVQLKGHRAVGGIRASLYNAMPPEGVRVLVQFMREFARTHG